MEFVSELPNSKKNVIPTFAPFDFAQDLREENGRNSFLTFD